MSRPALRFEREDELRALVRAFERGQEPPGGFSHQAHLAVALAYLDSYGLEGAIPRLRDALLAFLRRALGDDAAAQVKYRETITVFWLRLLATDLAAADARLPLHHRVNRIMERYRDPGVIRSYYSEARLYSPEARERFLEPDLKPLPPLG